MVFITSCILLLTSSTFAQFKISETATIDSAATLSSVVDLNGYTIANISFPASFQGTSVTLLTSATSDSASFKVYQYNNTDVTITASDGKINGPEPVKVWGILRYIRVLSDSAQTGLRTLTFYKTRL